MRRSTTLVLSLAATALLAACGTDDSTNTSMPQTTMGGDMGSDATAHGDESPTAEDARRIEVTAANLKFDPNEITITAGEDVAIVLTSHDLLHDFTIDELGAHVAAGTGDTVEGGLRADDPGRYTFYCSVPGHRAAGMEGTLVVEAP